MTITDLLTEERRSGYAIKKVISYFLKGFIRIFRIYSDIKSAFHPDMTQTPFEEEALNSSKSTASKTSVFAQRDYVFFWITRFFVTLGVMVEAITLGWQVYDIARHSNSVAQSAFLVGMVGLVQFVPLFFLTLIAGAVADHYPRKLISLVCLISEIFCLFGLIVISNQPHPALWMIFVIAAIFGGIRAFQGPATAAMGPMLVPQPLLPKAVAFSSLAWQSGAILGPWLGGVLVARSSGFSYVFAVFLFLISALSVSRIKHKTRPQQQEKSRLTLVQEGLAYVWQNKLVFGAISLDLFAVLLGGVTALLPVYARDILHTGASGFGVLRSGPAIGACVCAFILSRQSLKRRAGLWMFGGVALFGLSTLVFAVSSNLILSLAALAVLGAADMISIFVRQTLVQVVTPDAMRGRVAAVSSVFVGASNELGEFETGVITRILGPVGAALFGGIGSLVVTGIWAKLFPELRKADKLFP